MLLSKIEKKSINDIIYLEDEMFRLNLQSKMAYGVTGNTSGFGPEESRFEP